jgi:signal transduction histidine kinase
MNGFSCAEHDENSEKKQCEGSFSFRGKICYFSSKSLCIMLNPVRISMPKILVVEDDSAQLQTILAILRANDYEAIGSDNGIDGAELAKTQLPDLIISDIHMNRGGGYDLLASIRNNPKTSAIPVILITAMPGETGFRKAMEMGADDFLQKPFAPAELLAAVRTRLHKHQMLLRQANAKLEELRKAMSFTIPHELQTPLNGILGYSDILRKQYEDLESMEIAWMAERILKNARRLQRLLGNYLLYAQLELKRMDQLHSGAQTETHDAHEVVRTTVEVKAQEYGRVGDLHLDLAEGSVAISPPYFKKILEEIVDNALKFSKVGSPVFVASSLRPEGFVFTITDRGRGMSPLQIKEIGAFVQFDRQIYEQQGLGLGLILASRLAQLHGGQLTVQSEVGVGTTVKIQLPQA